MSLRDRQTLKNLFRNGSLPTQESFGDIIDSSINKIDDGFSKSMDDGLMLSPIGDSKKVLSIFKRITDKYPEWSLKIDENTSEEELINVLNFIYKNEEKALLTLSQDQRIGIKNQQPEFTLDVGGMVKSAGRVGGAVSQSEVPADGKWHNIIDGLNYCNAFEVTARVGVLKSGKHALLHAIAMSAFGNSSSKIKRTHVRFSFWRPIRIKLRWVGSTYNYGLQIKTSRNLGDDIKIKYYLSQLWDDKKMGIPNHYKTTE